MEGKLKEIREIVTRAPYLAAENAFVFVVGLVFVAIAVSGYLFYEYGYLVVRKEPVAQSELQFKQDVFQGILGTWDTREETSLEIRESNPKNIFKSQSN